MSSHSLFLVHLRDRPAALERFLGLVRRRELAVERLTVNPTPEGELELFFRLDESRTPAPRLVAELGSLLDLSRLERLGGGGGPVTATIEVTGNPDEVAGALGALRNSGLPFLVAAGRPSPEPPSTSQPSEENE